MAKSNRRVVDRVDRNQRLSARIQRSAEQEGDRNYRRAHLLIPEDIDDEDFDETEVRR